MDTILCIFLKLNIITSPGTYYTSQIDSFEQVYATPINIIKNDPGSLTLTLATYEAEVPPIVIIDDSVLR